MVSAFRVFAFLVVVSVLSSYLNEPEKYLSFLFKELIRLVSEFLIPSIFTAVILLLLLFKFRQAYRIVMKTFLSTFSAIFAVIGGIVVFEILALGIILLFFGGLLALIADGM